MSNNQIIQVPLSQLQIVPEVQSRVTLNQTIVADYGETIQAEIEAATAEARPPDYPFKDPILVVQVNDCFVITLGVVNGIVLHFRFAYQVDIKRVALDRLIHYSVVG